MNILNVNFIIYILLIKSAFSLKNEALLPMMHDVIVENSTLFVQGYLKIVNY